MEGETGAEWGKGVSREHRGKGSFVNKQDATKIKLYMVTT